MLRCWTAGITVGLVSVTLLGAPAINVRTDLVPLGIAPDAKIHEHRTVGLRDHLAVLVEVGV